MLILGRIFRETGLIYESSKSTIQISKTVCIISFQELENVCPVIKRLEIMDLLSNGPKSIESLANQTGCFTPFADFIGSKIGEMP